MPLNKVMLIGNVGKAVDARFVGDKTPGADINSGIKVATFTLATNEKYKDKNGLYQEVTEWHNIVVWRNLAEFAEKYIQKGTQLYVEGKIRTRSYVDQLGNKKYITEIVADNLQLLGRRADNMQDVGGIPSMPIGNTSFQQTNNSNQELVGNLSQNDVDEDDDLPF